MIRNEPCRTKCVVILYTVQYTTRRKERMAIMSQKLAGKVAVVTGASKGIGAGIALELAANGATVVVNYASSKAEADKVVDQISKQGGRAVALQADLSK